MLVVEHVFQHILIEKKVLKDIFVTFNMKTGYESTVLVVEFVKEFPSFTEYILQATTPSS